jgi:hypothetical protein
MIKALKHTVSNYMLYNIYFAHFQSKMRYSIIVWGGSKESIKILRLQKKVVRIMIGLNVCVNHADRNSRN